MAKEEQNPGVSYEFYIPVSRRVALYDPRMPVVNTTQNLNQGQAELRSGGIGEFSYSWKFGGWTPCSTKCGNGRIHRNVKLNELFFFLQNMQAELSLYGVWRTNAQPFDFIKVIKCREAIKLQNCSGKINKSFELSY